MPTTISKALEHNNNNMPSEIPQVGSGGRWCVRRPTLPYEGRAPRQKYLNIQIMENSSDGELIKKVTKF